MGIAKATPAASSTSFQAQPARRCVLSQACPACGVQYTSYRLAKGVEYGQGVPLFARALFLSTSRHSLPTGQRPINSIGSRV